MSEKEISTSGRIHPGGIREEVVGVTLSNLVVVEVDDACETDRLDLAPGAKETGAN